MPEKTGPQNSSLRKMLQPVADRVASGLIKTFPNITADKITNFGLKAVIAGSVLKAIPERISGGDYSLAALGLMAAGLISDGLDGAVSRQQKPASVNGALKDVLTDRIQESAMALSRIATATMRRDPLGVFAATLSGITGPWPSLLRARVEALDSVVPESGKNPLTILGMRLPRAISGMISTSYPKPLVPLVDLPIQNVFDGATSLSNIFAALERKSILTKAQKGELPKRLDPETQELGKKKAEALSKFNKRNFAIMLAAGTIGLISIVLVDKKS